MKDLIAVIVDTPLVKIAFWAPIGIHSLGTGGRPRLSASPGSSPSGIETIKW